MRDPLVIMLNGRRKNLHLYNDGPYTYDPMRREVSNKEGTTKYQLENGEQGGEEIAERWNGWYALYLMLKP